MYERNNEITSDGPPTNDEVLQTVTDIPQGEYTLLDNEWVRISWAPKCLCTCVWYVRSWWGRVWVCHRSAQECESDTWLTRQKVAITKAASWLPHGCLWVCLHVMGLWLLDEWMKWKITQWMKMSSLNVHKVCTWITLAKHVRGRLSYEQGKTIKSFQYIKVFLKTMARW